MTIAISLKVNGGVVLAADSASTLLGRDQQGGTSVINIYNSANKVFNLQKGLPVGAITWGSGSIGNASISTLIKDLRRRLSGEDPAHKDWHIDPDVYTIQQVAERLKSFIFDELYEPEFRTWQEKPALGFIIAGYSSAVGMADEYQVEVANGLCRGPFAVRQQAESGVTWSGEPEAINRLMFGIAGALPDALVQHCGVNPQDVRAAIDAIKRGCQAPLVMPAMPIQDAIDIAQFFVDLTIKFSHFNVGAPTVGGPIEIAAITKHEGFKWVKRKHYYNSDLNPRIP
jgi:hypothetical protein